MQINTIITKVNKKLTMVYKKWITMSQTYGNWEYDRKGATETKRKKRVM